MSRRLLSGGSKVANEIISEEVRHVFSEDVDISYILKRKNVKNFNLRIKPDSSIIVSAPIVASVHDVDEFIIRKKNYIAKSLGEIKQFEENGVDRQYISGEAYRLEGKNLRLKVISSNKNSIETDGVFLMLYVKDINDTYTKSRLIKKFYESSTRSVMNEVLDKYYDIFKKYSIKKPALKIRSMSTRWGSCSAVKGIITLNSRLIEAPRNCIEYVVMHELCHLIHPNHSKQFYSFLSMQMPDWKERKCSLDSFFYD